MSIYSSCRFAWFNTDSCPICYDPLNTDSVVAHNNGGEKHPIHEKCIKQWMKFNQTCPCCKTPVDPESLKSLGEKCFNFIEGYRFNNKLLPLFQSACIGFTLCASELCVGTAIGEGIFEGFGIHTVTIIAAGVLETHIGFLATHALGDQLTQADASGTAWTFTALPFILIPTRIMSLTNVITLAGATSLSLLASTKVRNAMYSLIPWR